MPEVPGTIKMNEAVTILTDEVFIETKSMSSSVADTCKA